ncbi:MAG: ATP synthase subunit I [Kiritimatiellaeota bacterium]|nr:ATP synthase subunit I [Kiritimatiellota bacterium]
MDIVIGILIGAVLGIINALVLRTGVRFAVKCGQRAKAMLLIIASYAIRYILIAVIIYVILKKGNMTVAVTTLGVLLLMTILLALIQRKRSPAEERGS